MFMNNVVMFMSNVVMFMSNVVMFMSNVVMFMSNVKRPNAQKHYWHSCLTTNGLSSVTHSA